MALSSRDTSPEVAAVLLEGYRRMSPAQKLAQAAALSRATRDLAVAGMRRRHPEASDREIHLRVAALTIDRDTMIQAFGWDPASHG